ncbi:MAG: flagellar hook-associated protein FlgL [Desulfococcaceae bacterium]|nr:flagellar hook-associated protein FlgL [Desulfococcaceae bacterium]
MRVTGKMMADGINSEMLRQSRKLFAAQQTVATGKKVNRPSDDPFAAGQILEYRAGISHIDQYAGNIDRAVIRIEVAEDTLHFMSDLLTAAREFAMTASGMPETDRFTAAEEVRNIREQIRQLANTALHGDYIFSGHKTDTPPVAPDNTYQGDDGEIRTLAGKGYELKINATGTELFQVNAGSEIEILNVLEDLETALLSNPTAIDRAMVDFIYDARNRIIHVRSENIARHSRLAASRSFLEKFQNRLDSMLLQTEEADIDRAVTDLKMQETAYEVVLETAARIIPPTLMDFLN